MSKLLTNLFIFCLGLCLAVVFAFRHHLWKAVSEAPTVKQEELASKTIPKKSFDSPVAKAARRRLEVTYANEKRAMLRSSYSRERRGEILRVAVEEGTLDSLQLIRTEYISFLPEYREEVLPLLKTQALNTLRLRFAEPDWLDWPSSAFSNEGGPTAARNFVDNVGLVHAELGRFLETAAQLYHGMYLSILSGNSYSLKDDLFYVIQGAERILADRKLAAIPARLMLDADILRDASFLSAVKQLRADLTLLYFHRQPKDLKTVLTLIEDLDPKDANNELVLGVSNLLSKLSLESSANYRGDVLSTVLDSSFLQELGKEHIEIRRGLAELFSIAAVDALERKELERAKGLLELSVKTESGLRAQEIVQKHLQGMQPQKKLEPVVQSKKLSEQKEAPVSRFGESLRRQAKTQPQGIFGSIIVYSVLIIGALIALAFAVLYLRGRQNFTSSSGESHDFESAPSTTIDSQLDETGEEELQFDELLGADEQLEAVNR